MAERGNFLAVKLIRFTVATILALILRPVLARPTSWIFIFSGQSPGILGDGEA